MKNTVGFNQPLIFFLVIFEKTPDSPHFFFLLSTDMSDVKVYVELASISAGENDTEIDQVACFHDAVMGYAPLLYSLSPAAGFKEFMKCAGQVWETQNRDEKLPGKLVFTYLLFCNQYISIPAAVAKWK